MRAYISLIAVLLLPAGVVSALAGGDSGGAAKELAAAARKAAAAKSYAFRIEERPGGGTGGAVTGKYAEGQPVFFQSDGIDFFRKGPALVYGQGGKWQRSKTGTESDPLRILGAAAKVRRARLPHEELAGLARDFKTVTKQQDKGLTVYSGELTGEAVKRLAPSEFRSVARSGRARAWVDGAGALMKYAVEIRATGRLGNADVDTTIVRTATLSDVNSARVEVPAAARKALE
jgi:hypothetical protein